MNEFKFLDYYTKYSCKGTINKKLSATYCFADIFKRVTSHSKIEVSVYLFKGLEQTKYSRSNACFFSLKEIKNHIKILQNLCSFSFSVKETDKAYIVTLNLKDLLPIYHKYILTWVRYLYEYPYNVLLKDTYKLKRTIPTFRYQSIATLFNVTLSCYPEYLRSVHHIPYLRNLAVRYSTAKLKQILNQDIDQLNNIYLYKENTFVLPSSLDDYTVTDIEYWEMGFEERLPVYMNTYKLLNKR